jgi:hypothetical protein
MTAIACTIRSGAIGWALCLRVRGAVCDSTARTPAHFLADGVFHRTASLNESSALGSSRVTSWARIRRGGRDDHVFDLRGLRRWQDRRVITELRTPIRAWYAATSRLTGSRGGQQRMIGEEQTRFPHPSAYSSALLARHRGERRRCVRLPRRCAAAPRPFEHIAFRMEPVERPLQRGKTPARFSRILRPNHVYNAIQSSNTMPIERPA